MKKFLLLILTFSYLATSSGASIYLHQCMGKFSSVDFGNSTGENGNCGKCGMEKNNAGDCCQDHVIVLKSSLDQSQPESLLNTIKLFQSLVPQAFPGNKAVYFSKGFKPLFSENNAHHQSPPDFQAFYCCILI
ncbi:MAG: hypothetical protein WAU24_14775 [Chitinophagaceae bacterium]